MKKMREGIYVYSNKIRYSMMESAGRKIAILIILIACLAAPVLADIKYTQGHPAFSASVSGINEYYPGDQVQIPVVIQNNGLNLAESVGPDIVAPVDLPNTAKSVTVTLAPGTAPLVVKSDPQYIGDLPGQGQATALFTVKINADAPAGTYSLPLAVNYTYLSAFDQYGSDTMRYTYQTNLITINLPVTIKPVISIDVISAVPDGLNAGTDGYINLTLKNTGSDNGSKAIVKILQNSDSPIVPIDSSVYVGDFPSGSIVTCQYKVSVSRDADSKSYPVDVEVVYQNPEGDFVTSRDETIGVPVGNKIEFEVVSPPAEMSPGSTKTILVEYKNTGNATVLGAQARIVASTPFASTNDISYLGDLGPGQSAVASFSLNVAQGATIKMYGLDSEIRYRDQLDTTYISDIMKVPVDVKMPTGITGIITNPVDLTIIVACIIGAVYVAYHFRKKR
jgi:hypothetical protein